MVIRLIFLFLLFLTTKCFVDKDSFCNMYDSEKNIVIENYLDSLKKQTIRPKTIENYFLLAKYEQAVSTIDLNVNSKFSYGILNNNLKDCKAYLTFLEHMKSEKYLKPTKDGKILSYIPVLTIDKFGEVKSIQSLIKYENGKIDTLSENESIDFNLLINTELKVLLNNRKLQIAKLEKENEKRRKVQDEIENQKENQHIKNKEQQQKQLLNDLEKNSISTKRLCAIYQENEVEADNQFLNQTILIKGVVFSVERTQEGISINLDGNDYLTKVCCITKDENVASKLRKGQLVIIEGTCKGMDDFTKTFVTISNSSVRAY